MVELLEEYAGCVNAKDKNFTEALFVVHVHTGIYLLPESDVSKIIMLQTIVVLIYEQHNNK